MKCVFYVLTFERRPQNRASCIAFIYYPAVGLQLIKTSRILLVY